MFPVHHEERQCHRELLVKTKVPSHVQFNQCSLEVQLSERLPSDHDVDSVPVWRGQHAVCHCFDEPLNETGLGPAVLTPFPPHTRSQSRRARVVNTTMSVSNLQMSSVERNAAEECRFTRPAPCRPFLGA